MGLATSLMTFGAGCQSRPSDDQTDTSSPISHTSEPPNTDTPSPTPCGNSSTPHEFEELIIDNNRTEQVQVSINVTQDGEILYQKRLELKDKEVVDLDVDPLEWVGTYTLTITLNGQKTINREITVPDREELYFFIARIGGTVEVDRNHASPTPSPTSCR